MLTGYDATFLTVRSEAPCSRTPLMRRKMPRRSRRRLGDGSTFEVKINLITRCLGEELSTPPIEG